MLAFSFFTGLHYLLYCIDQSGEIVLNDFPDDFQVHSEILMRQKISKVSYVLPLHIRASLLQLFRESADRLPDDLKLPDHGRIGPSILGELLEGHVPDIFEDGLSGVQDIAAVQTEVPLRHR